MFQVHSNEQFYWLHITRWAGNIYLFLYAAWTLNRCTVDENNFISIYFKSFRILPPNLCMSEGKTVNSFLSVDGCILSCISCLWVCRLLHNLDSVHLGDIFVTSLYFSALMRIKKNYLSYSDRGVFVGSNDILCNHLCGNNGIRS